MKGTGEESFMCRAQDITAVMIGRDSVVVVVGCPKRWLGEYSPKSDTMWRKGEKVVIALKSEGGRREKPGKIG